ncbi:MAG: HPF/RaiA family ribosome-associated protein [Deltaproteobacteria bacterium]|jgi:cold shock CspA family protein/ribosome-associated translation inhibitor RaiA
MRVPPEISFRNVDKTEFIENLIRKKISRLDRLCDYITSCRVAVESPQQHQQSGQPFRVRINLKVPPGHELVATREPSEGDIHSELPAILRDAFDAIERQLNKLVEQQRGETKKHPEQEINAFVSTIFKDEDYGFLKTLEGRDIYFHRNSVVQDDFDRLVEGTGVRYVEEQGEEGPQASTVQIVDKSGTKANTDSP